MPPRTRFIRRAPVGQHAAVAEVLGVEVSRALLRAWVGWLAPDPQPFLVADPDAWDVERSTGTITRELRDTYRLYRVEPGSKVLWLTEEQFASMPKPARAALVREQVRRRRGAVPTVRAWQDLLDPTVLRAQADGHRFVWWPSLVATDAGRILERHVDDRRLHSRHREVPASTWRACRDVLPGARRIAGSFATDVACCVSTVLEAAGADTSGSCDSLAPFAEWLAAACTPGGDSDRPGTVLVWRADGKLDHAAVSIGDGWGLEKPSQDWHSPRAVAAITDIVRMSRIPGLRLERHTIDR